MKSVRLALSMLVVVALFAATVFAQSGAKSPQSEAEKSFEKMKSLAGAWEGKLTTTPPSPEVEGKIAQVTLRVTSSGNAVMHEITIPGREDDPITMFYLDGDRLMLTHYCDAGNRPSMVAHLLPDGKLDFKFVSISGEMKYHMHHSLIDPIDADRHTEDWTFMMGDKPVIAHFDLRRKK